jgi:homoserine kinase type II
MAVYTDITDEELTAFIADYDLGTVLSFKGIAEGVENSNFLLVTEAGQFILTLYEKRVRADDLPFFLGLMEHLVQHGINCPLPVHTRSGEVLGSLADRPAAIVTFLPGMWVRRPRNFHCSALGRAMAQLHLAGDGFALCRPNGLSLDSWRPLFATCTDRVDEVVEGLGEQIATELDFLDANWPRGLPTGIIHADLFPDNVFFLRDQLSGLIDFYFACNDMFAYDIAIAINAWCFEPDRSLNVTKTQALLKAYGAVRPLNTQEIDVLPVLARGAALRFLLTRLHDWLTVPAGALVVPKDPIEYLTKLRFHRGVTSATDYGLTT